MAQLTRLRKSAKIPFPLFLLFPLTIRSVLVLAKKGEVENDLNGFDVHSENDKLSESSELDVAL